MIKLKRLGVLFFLAGLTAIALAAQPEEERKQSEANPSALEAQVDAIFERWDRPDSPGCAIGVMREGHLIYARGYGLADVEHGVPITPSTVFDIASVSKQFTAAAVALLAQRGKLSLDDDVRKYIPEVPDFGTPITLRHLIHHTSGLRIFNLDFGGGPEEVLDMVARLERLNFPPGEEHRYGGLGYVLLGIVVERVSGESLREFTRTEIFESLGMDSTFFRDDRTEIVKDVAYSYEPTREGGFRRRFLGSRFFRCADTGAGLLHTTVEDLARWDRNFYEPRVGGRAFIEQLHERGQLNDGERLDYAFGLDLDEYRGLPTVEHSGFWGGYRSHLMRFPEQRFSVAVLCNAGNLWAGEPARQVADLYLADKYRKPPSSPAAEQPVVLPAEQLADKVGLYWNPKWRGLRRITLEDGKLFLFDPADQPPRTWELEAMSERFFRVVEAPLYEYRFERAKPGDPWHVVRSRRGSPTTIIYERVEEFSPTPTELAAYAGLYLGDEVDLLYRVTVDDDELVLKRLGSTRVALQPVFKDLFFKAPGGLSPAWYLRFKRDSNGNVVGITFNNQRNRDFHFTRLEPRPRP